MPPPLFLVRPSALRLPVGGFRLDPAQADLSHFGNDVRFSGTLDPVSANDLGHADKSDLLVTKLV